MERRTFIKPAAGGRVLASQTARAVHVIKVGTTAAGVLFSSLIPALTGGKIDLIGSPTFITPDILEVISFSDPVYIYDEGLFVSKQDSTQYTKISDLKGQTVGTQIGSAYIKVLEQNGLTDLKFYLNVSHTVADLSAGRISAAFAHSPQAKYRIADGQFPNVRIVASYVPVMINSLAFGLRKEQTAAEKHQYNDQHVEGEWNRRQNFQKVEHLTSVSRAMAANSPQYAQRLSSCLACVMGT